MRAEGPPSPLITVIAHSSTASVPTSYYLMWHYNCRWTLQVKPSPSDLFTQVITHVYARCAL